MSSTRVPRFDLEGKEIQPLTICLIGGGGFIGSHLCEKLLHDTSHKVIAIDLSSKKIEHLFDLENQWRGRFQFHNMNIKNSDRGSQFETLIRDSDIVINLASICTPAHYNTRALDTITSNLTDAIPVVKYCTEYGKRLIHFSSSEVYGKTIGSFLPQDHPLLQDPMFYLLKEDVAPCILGTIDKQRWSYACAKQMIERLIYAAFAEKGLKFTIVRPFNWIGPRMDFLPGIDGPGDGVPRVLSCFANNILRGEPLKLVNGGKSQRTFCSINDGIEAVLLMIENPERANGQIFNVGNPNNEVRIKQFAELMIQVYGEIMNESVSEVQTVDVSSQDFYGVGYDDTDRRLPDLTIINKQLGWSPKVSLHQILLDNFSSYQGIWLSHSGLQNLLS